MVDFEGKWHRIPDGGINPLPKQKTIPIWIGGHSEATLRRVAKYGDGWLPNDLSLNETIAAMDRLEQYILKAGRTRAEVGVDAGLSYRDGYPDQWEGEIEKWRQAGATHLSLDTMGGGLHSPSEHIKALRNFAEKVNLTALVG